MKTALLKLLLRLTAVAGCAFAAASLSAGTGDAPAVQRGAKLFQTHCTACHGLTLPESDRRNLNDGVWHTVATPDDVAKVIEAGLPDHRMPGFKALLRPAQRADLTAYILSLPRAPAAAPGNQ